MQVVEESTPRRIVFEECVGESDDTTVAFSDDGAFVRTVPVA